MGKRRVAIGCSLALWLSLAGNAMAQSSSGSTSAPTISLGSINVQGSAAPPTTASQPPATMPGPSGPTMPSRVWLVIPECDAPPLDTAAFERLLRAELATDGVDEVSVRSDASSDNSSRDALALITLAYDRCDEDATEVTITVDDAVTRKSVRRVVDLADVASGSRPRTLSLATAELLRASWLELALPDTPPIAAAVPAPVRRAMQVRLTAVSEPVAPSSTAPPPPPLRTELRWGVALLPELRVFPTMAVTLAGGRAGVQLRIPNRRDVPSFRFRLDGGVSFVQIADVLGTVDLGLATAGLSAFVGGGSTTLLFDVGPRIELGGGWTRGVPAPMSGVDGGGGSAPMLLALLTAGVRVRITRGLWLGLEADAGFALLGLDARATVRTPAGPLQMRSVGGMLGGTFALRASFSWEQ